ncbi:hypothetical protein J7E29_10265 [Streptomyces sp. ISL-90]|nr:hypothetical protein [Streptomyces sp. ISL-90]
MFRTRKRAASGIAVFAMLATLALAGCAPTSPTGVASLDGGATPTESGSPDGEGGKGDQVKFTECMREQGIDMPDPDPNSKGFAVAIPQGVSKDAVDAAMEECKQYMPNGGEMPELSAEELKQMREFAKCMRENGIEDFPDPNAEGGMMLNGDDVDPESEEFQAAQEACEDLAPRPKDGEEEGPSTQTNGGSES